MQDFLPIITQTRAFYCSRPKNRALSRRPGAGRKVPVTVRWEAGGPSGSGHGPTISPAPGPAGHAAYGLAGGSRAVRARALSGSCGVSAVRWSPPGLPATNPTQKKSGAYASLTPLYQRRVPLPDGSGQRRHSALSQTSSEPVVAVLEPVAVTGAKKTPCKHHYDRQHAGSKHIENEVLIITHLLLFCVARSVLPGRGKRKARTKSIIVPEVLDYLLPNKRKFAGAKRRERKIYFHGVESKLSKFRVPEINYALSNKVCSANLYVMDQWFIM